MTQEIKSFKNFLWIIWDHLNLPDPTPVQYDIADYLQYGPRRKTITAFRGIGKSWITSAYVLWRLYNDPQVNIMVVSASKDRSDAFTTFTKRLITEVPLLEHLKPRDNQRDSMVAFDVGPAGASHAPSVRSVGIMGQMTGGRADEIIADDVEVPNNSDTVTMRLKLAERVKEFDAILKPGGKVTYLGTPQCEDSLYNELMKRGYEKRIWPMEVPNEEYMGEYSHLMTDWVHEFIEEHGLSVGDPLEPSRFNMMEIEERRLSYGNSGYALQFMLDTALSDANKYPLKLSDLIIMDIDQDKAPTSIQWSNDPVRAIQDIPCVGMGKDRYYMPVSMSETWIPYDGAVLTIDPSGRGKDKTAWNVTKHLGGNIWVTAHGQLDGGYSDEVLEYLAKVAKDQQVNGIVVESNFGDGMFSELFKKVLGRIYPCPIEEVRQHVQKELRVIDTLEPIMNQHRLIMDRKGIEQDYREFNTDKTHQFRLFYQMTRITKERGALLHDDGIDCLAMAVQYWVDQMSLDDVGQEKARLSELKDAEYEAFIEKHIFGDQGKSKSSWL
jgi:hypothetical protein